MFWILGGTCLSLLLSSISNLCPLRISGRQRREEADIMDDIWTYSDNPHIPYSPIILIYIYPWSLYKVYIIFSSSLEHKIGWYLGSTNEATMGALLGGCVLTNIAITGTVNARYNREWINYLSVSATLSRRPPSSLILHWRWSQRKYHTLLQKAI